MDTGEAIMLVLSALSTLVLIGLLMVSSPPTPDGWRYDSPPRSGARKKDFELTPFLTGRNCLVHGRENGKRLERSRRCAGRQRQVHDNRCRTDPRPRRAVSGFVVRLTGQAGEDDQNNLRSRVLYTFLNDTYPLIHSGHVHNDYERGARDLGRISNPGVREGGPGAII